MYKNILKKIYKYIVFLIIICFFGVMNHTKAQPLPAECEDYIDSVYCSNWGEWHGASTWFDIPSAPHNQWPSQSRTFDCPIKVLYKWRQCLTNPYIHQCQILSYVVDLSYKVWIFNEGWIYPCKEAIDLLEGNSNDVTLRNNELLENIFKKLLVSQFDFFRSNLPPDFPYALCNSTDTSNPNVPPVQFIARKGACQGICRVQRPANIITIDGFQFEIGHPPAEIFAEWYGVPLTGDLAVQVVDLNSSELDTLNSYIQTEINNGILEQEYKLKPIVVPLDATIIITPIDCTPDYCCIYEITLCVDDDGNTQVTEQRTGNIPSCLGYPPLSSCPEGTFKVVYPCKLNCENYYD